MTQQIIRSDRTIQMGNMSATPIVEQIFIADAVIKLDVEWLYAKGLAPLQGMTRDQILVVAHRTRLDMLDATPSQKMDSEIFLRLKGYTI